MIRTLRKKFILTSIISIFVVFTGIFLLLFAFTKVQINRSLDMLTDTISSNDGAFPPVESSQHQPPSRFPYLDVITKETPFTTRFFTVWLNEEQEIVHINMDSVATISKSDIERYARKAASRDAERGWISDYRYKEVDTQNGSIMVFVSGTMYQNTTNRLLFTVFLVLLGSAALILILIILISKPAVQPVAESYEKQKQFITNANHELKTPLTLILSNLDILESEFGKSEWLDDIRGEGERMGLLINQMVMLSRMDESNVHLENSDFSLSGAVEDTVSEFQGLEEERGYTISQQVQPELSYHGDESMIRRLIAILLDNAVKYCDPNGSIQVRLYQRRHPILTVENTYAAVDHLPLDKLFDRFYRADQVRTFSGSFGIGLSLAQSIARSHRGSITAYKRGGTIGFRFDLK